MNKVILMGRLTRDPEVRYANTNNTAVCTFNLAVNRRFAKQGDEQQANFFPIVAFGNLGEFFGKYFSKGRQVVIVGRLQTYVWEDAEGKKQKTVKVIAEEGYFADSKKASDDSHMKDFGSNDGYNIIDNDEDLPF